MRDAPGRKRLIRFDVYREMVNGMIVTVWRGCCVVVPRNMLGVAVDQQLMRSS
jgi:hypothetical protein